LEGEPRARTRAGDALSRETLTMREFGPASSSPPAPVERGHWHLDRRVPIALLAAILMQTAAFGFWVGGLVARVGHVEQWQTENPRVDARLAVLESQTAEIMRIVGRLESRMLAARTQPE